MEPQFDMDAVESWVALCRDEAVLRAQGQSETEAYTMRVQVILGMVNLLPTLTNEEKMNLALLLLACESPVAPTEPVHEDPKSPDEASQTSQTTEQADLPSQGPP